MKTEEAGQVLHLLAAGFHRESLEDATIDLWMDILSPLEAELATRVALDWVKSEDRFPSISQFRHAYHSTLKREKPNELSAAYVAVDTSGLPVHGCPQWVQRWRRARAGGDFRVFPEQIVEGRAHSDDPRYSRDEALRIGIMPEEYWLTAEQIDAS